MHNTNIRRTNSLKIAVTSHIAAGIQAYQELGDNCVATAFQTRLWIECWLARLAQPRGACALFCTVRDGDGTVVMLLPLCLRTDGYLRVIEGADLGVSDYLAPVVASSFELTPSEWAVVWRRIVAALPAHDLLRLSKIPLFISGRPNPLAMIKGARKLELQSHGVPVSTPWNECVKETFSRNRREKLRKGWRELSQMGNVRFRVVDDEIEMAHLFEQLMDLRRLRFDALNRPEPLRDQDFAGFYRSIIEQGTASGFARLSLIEIDELVVAMQFGVCHADAFHLLISAFLDTGRSQLAPGLLLSARTMQWAAEEGLKYYDFTIGNEDYKGRLGARSHDLLEVVSSGSWRGVPTIAKSHLKRSIKGRPWLLAIIAKARNFRAAHKR